MVIISLCSSVFACFVRVLYRIFYFTSVRYPFNRAECLCSRREVAEGLFDSAQCIVRLICRMTDRICFFITILNIRNATVEQILIFWHYADFIFPQSTKFIRRKSIL